MTPFNEFQSGNLVRSRSSLCIGSRGAMVNQGARNFLKNARGVCIVAVSKKITAGSSFGVAARLDSDLRGAMVYNAFQNLLRARPLHFSILGFRLVPLT